MGGYGVGHGNTTLSCIGTAMLLNKMDWELAQVSLLKFRAKKNEEHRHDSQVDWERTFHGRLLRV